MSLEVPHILREGIYACPVVDKCLDAAPRAEQQRAVIIFGEGLDSVRLAGKRMEFRRSGSPPPQPVVHSNPQRAVTVLIQAQHGDTQTTVLSEASNTATLDCTESSARSPNRARPDRSFVILDQPKDILSRQLRVNREPAVLPTRKSICSANPQRAIARSEERPDTGGRQLLFRRWLPCHVAHAVEAKQSELRTEPQIPIGRLSDGSDDAPCEALADPP